MDGRHFNLILINILNEHYTTHRFCQHCYYFIIYHQLFCMLIYYFENHVIRMLVQYYSHLGGFSHYLNGKSEYIIRNIQCAKHSILFNK